MTWGLATIGLALTLHLHLVCWQICLKHDFWHWWVCSFFFDLRVVKKSTTAILKILVKHTLCSEHYCTDVSSSPWFKETVTYCLRPPALNEGCGKSVFVDNYGAHTLLETVIWLFIPASVHLYLSMSLTLVFCRDLWSTHFAWNSNMAVYSSLCTLVHGQTCRWLTLDKPAGGLRAPLFWPMRAEPI